MEMETTLETAILESAKKTESAKETAILESAKETATLGSAKQTDNHEVKKSSDTSSMERREKIYVLLCGVLTLTPIILIILALFSLPTVFYTSQKNSQSAVVDNTEITTDCLQLQVVSYSGEICRNELTSLYSCFSGESTSLLLIPVSIPQESSETDAMLLVNGLIILTPSEECLAAIVPFLCLALFPLCGPDRNIYTIAREDCLSLRNEICVDTWRTAVQILGPGVLPICEELPDVSNECIITNMTTAMPSIPALTADLENDSLPLECPENFFFNENGRFSSCIPICGEFSYFEGVKIFHKVAVCASFIASVAMIVITLAIQRKKMLVFPLILPFYLCITTLFLSAVIIVGFFDSTKFYCSSRDYFDAAHPGAETGYCVFVSAVVNYCLLQITVWTILQAMFMFWSVAYPFRFRQLKNTGNIRYAHIISILLALLIPLPSAFIQLVDGSVFVTSLVLPCLGRSVDYIYYTFILPDSLLIMCEVITLVFIIWILFKDFVLKKLLAKKKVTNIGVAELKITALIIVNLGLGVVGLVTYIFADMEVIVEGTAFAFCVADGGPNCSQLKDRINTINITLPIAFTFLALVPVMAIVVTCDVQAFKNMARVWTRSKK